MDGALSLRPTWRRTVAAVLILGALVTLLATGYAKWRADEGRQNDASRLAADTAENFKAGLEEALRAADFLVQGIESRWFPQADYERFWNQISDALPGDTAAILVVAVPSSDLDAFEAAERELSPGFEIGQISPNPASGQHYFSARGAPAGELSGVAGGGSIDLGIFPGLDARFNSLAPSSRDLRAEDFRKPGLVRVPGQLQAIIAHPVKGPTGAERQAWTNVQIDARPLLARASADTDATRSVVLSVADNPELSTAGSALDGGKTSTATGEVAGLRFDIMARSIAEPPRLKPRFVLASGLLLTALLALIAGVAHAVSALASRVGVSERAARRDTLTGLPNRRWLMERFASLPTEASESTLLLIYIDLDRFKVVNDSLGHRAGDDLLCQYGDRLDVSVGGATTLARLGGDEFVAMAQLPAGVDPAIVAENMIEACNAAVVEPFSLGQESYTATHSLGIAWAPVADLASPEHLLHAADAALRDAKRGSGNTHNIHAGLMDTGSHDRLALEAALRSALDAGDLQVHYQPIVDDRSRVISFEALVRWHHDGRAIPPLEFLPVVRDLGRLGDLGQIVMDGALEQLGGWLREDEERTLHANVDPAELLDPLYVDRLQRKLAARDVAPASIILEITEQSWFDATGPVRETLQKATNLGVGLAVDDFGAGYSALGRILDLDGLTEIKIDRSISARIDENSGGAFIEAFAQVASKLGLRVIAEGVETVEQHEALRKAGAEAFQGFLFGRPSAQPLRAGSAADATARNGLVDY